MPSNSSKRKARRRSEAVAEALAAKQEAAAKFSYLTTPRCDVTTNVPAEILLEVISYFYAVPFDSPSHKDASNEGYYLNERALQRSKVLRAMSQTCRSWRALLLPILYGDLELGAIAKPLKVGGQWYTQCSDRLLRICGGLAAHPELAQYTRNVRVVLSQHCLTEALASLVKSMRVCSNLKVLNIHFAQTNVVTYIKTAFHGYSFPSVETVILPSQAHHVLRSCPNVKKVLCHQGDGSQIASAMQSCKHVEVLEGIHYCPSIVKHERAARLLGSIYSPEVLIGLVIARALRIRELRFCASRKTPTVESLELVCGLQHLRILELRVPWTVFQDPPLPAGWEPWHWAPPSRPPTADDLNTKLKPQLEVLSKHLRKCELTIKPSLSSYDGPERGNWAFTTDIRAA